MPIAAPVIDREQPAGHYLVVTYCDGKIWWVNWCPTWKGARMSKRYSEQLHGICKCGHRGSGHGNYTSRHMGQKTEIKGCLDCKGACRKYVHAKTEGGARVIIVNIPLLIEMAVTESVNEIGELKRIFEL